METFTISPTGYERRRYSPAVRSDDDGAHHQRQRGNVNVRGWKLSFENVTWAEANDTEDFFALVRANIFYLYNPENGSELVPVQFVTTELSTTYINYRKATSAFEVQEVLI